MNEKVKKAVDSLVDGQVLLSTVRKTTRGEREKAYLEAFMRIENPNRPQSALSILNEGDDRFSGNRARPGWLTSEPAVAAREFGFDLKAFEELESSTDIPAADWKEGRHYLVLNKMNPSLSTPSGKVRLGVRVTESHKQDNDEQPHKINPTTDEPVLSDGQKVYVRSVIDLWDRCIGKSTFLLSDTQTLDAVGIAARDVVSAEKE